MEAAPLIMIIIFCIAIAVVAAFLITVVTVLYQIWSRINTILGVVDAVCEKTEVLDPVLGEIKEDLAGGHAAIEGAVERLKTRKGFTEGGEQPVQVAAAGPPPPAYVNY